MLPVTTTPSTSDHPIAPALLSRCKTPRDADQIHAHLITTGLLRCPNALLSISSSPHPPLHHLARRLLASSLHLIHTSRCDPFLWNSLIKSASHGKHPSSAFPTFALMLSSGVSPDRFTFSLALKACSRMTCLEEGSQIHGLLLKGGLGLDLFLQNCMVRFYCRCGLVEIARRVFDRMVCRDSVSWNSMIDGYVKMGMVELAWGLFDQMGEEERSLVTWNSMISGYAHLESDDGICAARELFDRMPDRDLTSWNSMIDGYVKCGRLRDALDLFEQMPVRDVVTWANIVFGYMENGSLGMARHLFDTMPEKDVIAWNIMMSGYVKNGCFVEALNLFHEMKKGCNIAPDTVSLATVLSAIAKLGCIQEGIAVHDYITRNQLPMDGKLGVALIDLYAKCGQLDKAVQIFETSGRRSVDHWNAMIGGLSIHGLGHLSLRLFTEMVRLSLKPDDITFIGVLSACSHSGLVKEGLTCFQIMRTHYNLEPKIQHYGCMVDILGRAGRIEDARKLIEEMPMEPNDVILRALFSACRNQGNIGVGQSVANHLIEMDSCNPSSYVLLSNIYAGIGMWNYVTDIRMMMKERDIKKVPGCSWIELDGIVHEFVVGDKAHPQAKEIYSLLYKRVHSDRASQMFV